MFPERSTVSYKAAGACCATGLLEADGASHSSTVPLWRSALDAQAAQGEAWPSPVVCRRPLSARRADDCCADLPSAWRILRAPRNSDACVVSTRWRRRFAFLPLGRGVGLEISDPRPTAGDVGSGGGGSSSGGWAGGRVG